MTRHACIFCCDNRTCREQIQWEATPALSLPAYGKPFMSKCINSQWPEAENVMSTHKKHVTYRNERLWLQLPAQRGTAGISEFILCAPTKNGDLELASCLLYIFSKHPVHFKCFSIVERFYFIWIAEIL